MGRNRRLLQRNFSPEMQIDLLRRPARSAITQSGPNLVVSRYGRLLCGAGQVRERRGPGPITVSVGPRRSARNRNSKQWTKAGVSAVVAKRREAGWRDTARSAGDRATREERERGGGGKRVSG